MRLTAFDELLGRRVSMRALAVLRVPVGVVTLLHLRPFLERAGDGRIYRDLFHEPYASWYPELPRALYVTLLWIAALAAFAMTIGLATRIATVITFAAVTYNLFVSTTHMHNNRAYLVIVLAALAVAPCGREFSVDAHIRSRHGRPLLDPNAPGWPLWLLRFEASVVYGASGVSKLLDPDWFGGRVAWERMLNQRANLENSPLPDWAVSVLTDRTFNAGSAKVVVLTEIFIAGGAVVAPHPLPGCLAGGGVPRRHRTLRVRPGVLVPRDLGATDLGRAVDSRPGADRGPGGTQRPPPAHDGARARLAGTLPSGTRATRHTTSGRRP